MSDEQEVKIKVKCVTCGKVRELWLAEIVDEPYCDKCFSPCIAVSVEVKNV